MREKMARAIHQISPDHDLPWDEMHTGIRDIFLSDADAALAVMEELFATAAECADDLAAHLDAEHWDREEWPTIQRSYDQDMDVVVRLRAMVEKLK